MKLLWLDTSITYEEKFYYSSMVYQRSTEENALFKEDQNVAKYQLRAAFDSSDVSARAIVLANNLIRHV